MNNSKNNQGGFITTIILIIVALVVLKYFFNVNINDLMNTKVAQDAWLIIKQLFSLLWQAIIITIEFAKIAIVQIKDFIATLPQASTK